MHAFNEIFIQVISLLGIAVIVTSIAKFFNLPYTIALVVAGLALGTIHIDILDPVYQFVTNSSSFQIIIISIFLPVILGEATIKMPFSHLNEHRKPILFLAFAGSFLSYAIIGFGAMYFLDLPLQAAFIFGALMAATDPISVLSVFKTKGVNRKLTTILEGESLFNDGIAVVLFKISSIYLLEYVALGWSGLGLGVIMFLKFAIGGFLLGALAGYIMSHITRLFDDYPLEIVFSILLFFGIYFLAEHLHFSGVIATAVSGIVYGSYGTKIGMTPVTKMNIKNFWEVVALIANAIIFFMVGLQINNISFNLNFSLIIGSILLVIFARAISVYLSLAFVKLPMTWKHIINWGGLRGSLSIALVLSLPKQYLYKEELLIITFTIVVFSLLIQTISLDPFINWLGLANKSKGIDDYDETITQIQRVDKALEKLESLHNSSLVAGKVYGVIKTDYEKQINHYHEQLQQLYETYPEIAEEQNRDIRRELLYTEHEAINRLLQQDIINTKVADRQKRMVIEQIEELEANKGMENNES